MEARSAWVAHDVAFRLGCGFRDGAEFGGKEGEVGHGQSSPLKALCCRAAKRVSRFLNC